MLTQKSYKDFCIDMTQDDLSTGSTMWHTSDEFWFVLLLNILQVFSAHILQLINEPSYSTSCTRSLPEN